MFYVFLGSLYGSETQNKNYYYEAVSFIEKNYELFPQHLRGKCMLYDRLYNYYRNESESQKGQKFMTFSQFL